MISLPTIVLVGVLGLLSTLCDGQLFAQWVRQSGSYLYDSASGIAVDSGNNIYSVGSVSGYSSGNLIEGQSYGGSDSGILIKFNSEGSRLWARLIGGTPRQYYVYGVSVDSSDNIYVVGYGRPSNSVGDIYLWKYSSSGTRLWTQVSNSTADDGGNGDGSGNVYVAGYVGAAIDGQVYNGGNQDVVLIKYTTSGSKVWTRLAGSTSSEVGNAVTTDFDGNVYVVGYTTGAFNSQSYAGGISDVFLLKFAPSGDPLWTRLAGSTASNYDQGCGVAVDNVGDVYVAGYAAGIVNSQAFAGGSSDILLLKYSSSGTRLWTRMAGAAGADFSRGVAVDSDGYVYVVGAMSGNLDNQVVSGSSDVSLMKYNSTGSRLWTMYFGSSSSDNAKGVIFGGDNQLVLLAATYGAFLGQKSLGNDDIVTFKLSTTSMSPTSQPSSQPTRQPFNRPTGQPSRQPTSQPTRQPSRQPTSQPTRQPSRQPTSQPSRSPSNQPSSRPTSNPTQQPSGQPSCRPSSMPSAQPTMQPSTRPTNQPSTKPSAQPSYQFSSCPTSQPSMRPSAQPSSQPSVVPSFQSSMHPSTQPTTQPTSNPSIQPSIQPSGTPSVQPSTQPSAQPSSWPSSGPSAQPSIHPSMIPSTQPSARPTTQPTSQPTAKPSKQPSCQPSGTPSVQPTRHPSSQPSLQPQSHPTVRPSSQPSGQPSNLPSCNPSHLPSSFPSSQPSNQPSNPPTSQPSNQPSSRPSSRPSNQPSSQPTSQPSNQPSSWPSSRPSNQPSSWPSSRPSNQPSSQPTSQPSNQPSNPPTSQPSNQPSSQPTSQPSNQPSSCPSSWPSSRPSNQPSSQPTSQPSNQPSNPPTSQPSNHPSNQPSSQPTSEPSNQPSNHPSNQPSSQPTRQPSNQPSNHPSSQPTSQPSSRPSNQPSSQPTSQPSNQPSNPPTSEPSNQPSNHPSYLPSTRPTRLPTSLPSATPSALPSLQPLSLPTSSPTNQPTSQPSSSRPSGLPSGQPSNVPSYLPVSNPSSQPTSVPTFTPTAQPTNMPASSPSTDPTSQPTRKPSSYNAQPTITPLATVPVNPSYAPTTHPIVVPSPTMYPSSLLPSSITRSPTISPTRILLSPVENKLSDLLSSTIRNASSPSRNSSSNTEIALNAGATVADSLLQYLLSSQKNSSSSQPKTVVAVSNNVQVVVSLLDSPKRANSSSHNGSSVVFLPTISLPNSQSSITVAAPQSGTSSSGSSLTSVSVISLGTNNGGAVSAQNSSIPLTIRSDLISVKVSPVSSNGSLGKSVLPSFIANISLNDAASGGSSSHAPVFSHNCTIGHVETVSYLCPDSRMWFNLTCRGVVAVSVRRQCPVPTQVCNVLSVSTWSVVSSEYCQATQSAAGYVVCRCGLNNATSAKDVAAVVASGGAVNVAVMTQYIAGDFGSIGGSSGVSIDSFAQQSSAIFVVFASLWGFGFILMTFHYRKMGGLSKSKKVDVKKDRDHVDNLLVVVPEGLHANVKTTETLDSTTSRSNSRPEQLIWSYAMACLPVSFQLGPWWERLGRLLILHHSYCRAVSFLCMSSTNSNKRKMAIMQVAQLLTLVMVSFLVLAVIYDFQFPPDDGSCALYAEKSLCLTRRSLLDRSVTYCTWVAPSAQNDDQTKLLIGNVLVESRHGAIIQSLNVDGETNEDIHCHFNNSESSILITVLSIVIASIVSIPADLILTMLFARIEAHTLDRASTSADVMRTNQVAPLMDGEVPGPLLHRSSSLRQQVSLRHREESSEDKAHAALLPSSLVLLRRQVVHALTHLRNPCAMDNNYARNHSQQGARAHNDCDDADHVLPAEDVDGVQLIQCFIGEILAQRRHGGVAAKDAARIYRFALAETFPPPPPATPLRIQVLCMTGVLVINVGALFFVALKGVQRGVAWQGSFLTACALEWVTDVFFVSVVEVWVMNMILPSFAANALLDVRGDIQTAILHFLAQQYALNDPSARLRRTNSADGNVDNAGDNASNVTPSASSMETSNRNGGKHLDAVSYHYPQSVAIIRQQPTLFESTFLSSALSLQDADIITEPRFRLWRSSRRSLLLHRVLDLLPLEVLHFLVSLAASLSLGMLLYLSYLVTTLRASSASSAGAILLQMLLFGSLAVSFLAMGRICLQDDSRALQDMPSMAAPPSVAPHHTSAEIDGGVGVNGDVERGEQSAGRSHALEDALLKSLHRHDDAQREVADVSSDDLSASDDLDDVSLDSHWLKSSRSSAASFLSLESLLHVPIGEKNRLVHMTSEQMTEWSAASSEDYSLAFSEDQVASAQDSIAHMNTYEEGNYRVDDEIGLSSDGTVDNFGL